MALWPRSSPSTMPAAMASTFFSAPQISTPVTSVVVLTRMKRLANSCCTSRASCMSCKKEVRCELGKRAGRQRLPPACRLHVLHGTSQCNSGTGCNRAVQTCQRLPKWDSCMYCRGPKLTLADLGL